MESMANRTKAKHTIKHKRFVIDAIIVAVVLLIASVVALFIYPSITNASRKERIVQIYDSLQLSDDYITTYDNVFGDKRVYEWDAGRTYSSSRHYLRGADVDVTTAELKKLITDAGFVFFDEPYPGAADTQLHFKSDKGEYIRLSVSSKLRDDDSQNKRLMGVAMTDADFNLDWNSGPSTVIIKVNLDDNNE